MTKKRNPTVLLEDDRRKICMRFVRARKAANVTQREYADAIGISGNALNEVEQGRELPSLEVLAGVRPVLGVSPEWVLHGGTTPDGKPPREYIADYRVDDEALATRFRDDLQAKGYVVSWLEALKLARLTSMWSYREPDEQYRVTRDFALMALGNGLPPSDERTHKALGRVPEPWT